VVGERPVLGDAEAIVAGKKADLRVHLRGGDAIGGARLHKAQAGDGESRAAGERLPDKLIQFGIAEALPPATLWRRVVRPTLAERRLDLPGDRQIGFRRGVPGRRGAARNERGQDGGSVFHFFGVFSGAAAIATTSPSFSESGGFSTRRSLRETPSSTSIDSP